jgi:hypothetical protein
MRLFVVNLRAVKRVGLPPTLLVLADRVVEQRKRSFLGHCAACAIGTMSA